MVNYQFSYVSCAPGVSPTTGSCADLNLTNYNTVKNKKVPFLDPYGISNNMTNFDIYMNVTKTDNLSNQLGSAQIKCNSNVSNTPSKYFRMQTNTTGDNINNYTCTFKDSSCLNCFDS